MPDQPPNIVLIVTDQQRYDSLGCTGNPHAVTPNLDALVDEACIFDRHITANTVCMPSRASLATGRYPASHGVWINGIPIPRQGYTAAEHTQASHLPTLADVLAEAGYATASVGKLHLTPTQCDARYGYHESVDYWRAHPEMKHWRGPYYGFEHVLLTQGHGQDVRGHFGLWLDQQHPDIARRIQRGPAALPFPDEPQLFPAELTLETHHSTWVGRNACQRIEQHAAKQQPLFMWVGFPDPHHPFSPPGELAEAFASRDYLAPAAAAEALEQKASAFRALGSLSDVHPDAVPLIRRYTDAMVHLIDREVGRIITTLRQCGMWDNTLFVFTSDHGDWLGDFGLVRKGPPACNALTHTPLIMHAPGQAKQRITAPVSNTDILPTFCEAAGVAAPSGIHGQSLYATMRGEARPIPVISQMGAPDPERANLSLVDERYRYTFYPATGERELYDHEQDPHENVNLLSSGAGTGTPHDQLHAQLLQAHARTWHPQAGRLCNW